VAVDRNGRTRRDDPGAADRRSAAARSQARERAVTAQPPS